VLRTCVAGRCGSSKKAKAVVVSFFQPTTADLFTTRKGATLIERDNNAQRQRRTSATIKDVAMKKCKYKSATQQCTISEQKLVTKKQDEKIPQAIQKIVTLTQCIKFITLQLILKSYKQIAGYCG
jgi:hypothetical protein